MALEELKAVLRYRKISYRELAEELGLTKSTISNKINNKLGGEFTSSEILKIAQYLDLTSDEAIRYFFPDLVA